MAPRMMTCRTWRDSLPDYLAESLSPEEVRAFEQHAASCEGCRRLLRAVRDGEPLPQTPDLTQEVLARTSGPSCRAVERWLTSQEERDDATYRAAVRAHLASCARCRALEEVLSWVTPLLPTMAEVPPGPRFVPAVVRATSGAPSRPHRRRRHRPWKLVPAPLFQWQVAYVGAVLLVVIGTSPLSLTHRADLLTVPLRPQPTVPRAAAALCATVQSLMKDSESTLSSIVEEMATTRAKAADWHRGLEESVGLFRSHIEGLVGATREGDLVAAASHASAVRDELARLIRVIRGGGPRRTPKRRQEEAQASALHFTPKPWPDPQGGEDESHS